MEVVLSVTPTLSSQIHGNIYILYIYYIYYIYILYICGNHCFNDFCQGVRIRGFIFHSVGIRQNWAEKLRFFLGQQMSEIAAKEGLRSFQGGQRNL